MWIGFLIGGIAGFIFGIMIGYIWNEDKNKNPPAKAKSLLPWNR